MSNTVKALIKELFGEASETNVIASIRGETVPNGPTPGSSDDLVTKALERR